MLILGIIYKMEWKFEGVKYDKEYDDDREIWSFINQIEV